MLKAARRRTQPIGEQEFLNALGRHCQKLRRQSGISIDRLSKEGEKLSTSVIHRLETASGSVTASALYRYAQALGVEPKDLLDFPLPAHSAVSRPPQRVQLVPLDDPAVRKEAFKTLLPLYSLKAAAGYFGTGRTVEPEGWVRLESGRKLDRGMFVVRAKGNSMLPKIHDGDLLIFRSAPSGTKQGKIVLVQYRGPADPETGGSYTVKLYHSSKSSSRDGGWSHRQITLLPTNPDYDPIVLFPKDESDFRVVGEFVGTV